MRFTLRSILFLFSLTTLAVFFFGFNAGKYISTIDKANPIITPTVIPEKPSPSPTFSEKPSSFSRITVDTCGISFLLPSSFEKTSWASQEARFTHQSETVHINCQKEYLQDITSTISTMASSSAILLDQRTTIYASDEASIIVLQNKLKQSVYVTTSHRIEDLVKDTLKLQ